MRFARPLPATGASEHREVASTPPSDGVAWVAFDVRCRAHARFGAAGQDAGHQRSAGDHLCGRHRGRRHRSLRAAGRSPHGAPYSRQTYGDGAGDAGRGRHPRGELSRRAGAAGWHRDDDVRQRADSRAADRRAQSRLRHEQLHLDRRHHQGYRSVHLLGANAVQDHRRRQDAADDRRRDRRRLGNRHLARRPQ